MAAKIDPLVVGRVIGDVVDMFVPSVTMSVHYANKHVTNGCDIKPSIATEPPKITLGGNANDFYTLVMTDPDAPSPSEPSMREWVHWIVTDIPGGSNVARGKDILGYVGPRPPVGIHRYILVLFRQKAPMSGMLQPPIARSHFCTRMFAQHLDLGVPVATVYFNAHKEPANRGVEIDRRNIGGHDMEQLQLTKDMTLDRNVWRT
ncbi:Protein CENTRORADIALIS [Capsicum annuum]|nr:Protein CENTRORADIALIS [Capsicum annuum]